MFETRIPYNISQEWFFVYFVVALAVYAYAKWISGCSIVSLLGAYIYKNPGAEVKLNTVMQANFMLDVLAVSSIAFFFSIQYFQWLGSEISVSLLVFFLFSLVLVSLFWLLKALVHLLLGWIFAETELFKYIIWQFSSGARAMGILLIPINVLAVYLPFSFLQAIFILGWSVFVLLVLFGIYRIVFSFRKINLSFSYIFLYLCALEILPVLAIFKSLSLI